MRMMIATSTMRVTSPAKERNPISTDDIPLDRDSVWPIHKEGKKKKNKLSNDERNKRQLDIYN